MPTASPGYRLLAPEPDRADSPLADEGLLARATTGPVACLWQASQGLVVPRTYAALPAFATTARTFAGQGWPIHVRQSGGGVVPQGHGILNLSLAQPFPGRPLDHSEALYRHLCDLIRIALAPFDIEVQAQAVEGSFCDGRYNLAVLDPVRKVVGTAQVWRRMPGQPRDHQVGLVHALILAQCDPEALTARANALETALGSARRYESGRIASLDQLAPPARRPGFAAALQQALQHTLLTARPLAAPLLA